MNWLKFLHFHHKLFRSFGEHLIFFPDNAHTLFSFGGERTETKIVIAGGADAAGTVKGHPPSDMAWGGQSG